MDKLCSHTYRTSDAEGELPPFSFPNAFAFQYRVIKPKKAKVSSLTAIYYELPIYQSEVR